MNIGDRFNTIEEIKEKCNEYAKNNNFYFKYVRSDKHCLYARCGLTNCLFEMRFFRSIDKRHGSIVLYNYKLTSIINHHTCNCEDGTVDYSKLDTSTLENQLRSVVLNDMTIKTRSLITIVEGMTTQTVKNSKIYRIKKRIIDKYKYNFRKCYQYIYSFVNFINDIGGYGIFKKNPSSTFIRVFIGPLSIKSIKNYTRKLISLDGAHIKNIFSNTLLVATCLDPNNN